MKVYTEEEVRKLIKAFKEVCEKHNVPTCEFPFYYPQSIEVTLFAKQEDIEAKIYADSIVSMKKTFDKIEFDKDPNP